MYFQVVNVLNYDTKQDFFSSPTVRHQVFQSHTTKSLVLILFGKAQQA